MKIKALLVLLCLASVVFALFTKHSEVIFMGDSRYCYNYGFPLCSFVTDSNDSVIHIHALNIVINILLLSPVFISTALCSFFKNCLKINKIITCIFLLMAAFMLALPWDHKKYVYCCAVILYCIWLIWFSFLICRSPWRELLKGRSEFKK